MLDTVNNLLSQLPQLCELFYMDKQKEAYAEFSGLMSGINKAMLAFIEAIPAYNEQGAGIPLEVVVAQLNNLMEALQARDTIMLADCLCHEITESLGLYKQLLEEGLQAAVHNAGSKEER